MNLNIVQGTGLNPAPSAVLGPDALYFQWIERLLSAVGDGDNLIAGTRVLRDVLVEECGFDRAGVFLYDPITDTMQGTWGTDLQGAAEDISLVSFCLGDCGGAVWQTGVPGDPEYVIQQFPKPQRRESAAHQNQAEFEHCSILLKAGGELVGFVAVDNLPSGRPLLEENLRQLMPFIRRTSLLVETAKLRSDRRKATQKQVRMSEIALGITASKDTSSVYLHVRNAILEIGAFDRASVWVIDGDEFHGTWGTTAEGALCDEHHIRWRFTPNDPYWLRMANPNADHLIEKVSLVGPNGELWEDVPRATIPMRADGELLGYVSVDTLPSRRVITPAMIEELRPITDQAAIAALNLRLRARREALIATQASLAKITMAILCGDETDAVFKMVRDAIVDVGLADRAGVWLIEGNTAWGTWGTDNLGQVTDEHGRSFSVEAHLAKFGSCFEGSVPYIIDKAPSEALPNGEIRTDIPHALIPLRNDGKIIGLIGFDNLITRRPITAETIELIAPFATNAAVIVEKRRMYKALNRELGRRKELESALMQQTRELVAARDEAQAGNRAKTEFLAAITHEIHTPLNEIQGIASMLAAAQLDGEPRAWADHVKHSSERLTSIFDDILDLGDLENKRLTLSSAPFSIRKCVNDVVESTILAPRNDAVVVQCHVQDEIPDILVGDCRRFGHVLKSLIHNGVKFTERGKVDVAIECIRDSQSMVRIRCVVAEPEVGGSAAGGAVFKAFTRGSAAASGSQKAIDLGLSVTKRLVELMGGNAYLEDSQGRGTRACIELAFEKSPTLESVEGGAPSTTTELLDLRVLVADDNPLNALVLVSRLEKWGCACVTVENGREALEAAVSQPFDVVLMDVSMPQMDGLEATRRWRAAEQPADSRLPIVAVTAHSLQADRDRCLAAGMDDFLCKPVNFDELLRILRRVAGRG